MGASDELRTEVLAASLVYSERSHEPFCTSEILLGNLCVAGIKRYKPQAVNCLKAVFAVTNIFSTIRLAPNKFIDTHGDSIVFLAVSQTTVAFPLPVHQTTLSGGEEYR